MTTSTALIGPVQQVRFQDGTLQVYSPPRDTLDLRYRTCVEHHPACDCREAEFAEQRSEFRSELLILKRMEAWAAAVAELHQRRPNDYVPDYCAECNAPWPCSTWRLTADADFGTRLIDKYHEGRVTR